MKINTNFIFKIFALLFAFTACAKRENPDKFVIEGKITGAEGSKFYLEELTVDKLSRIDSTVVTVNGTFSFSHLPPETGFYLLKNETGKFVTLSLGKGEKNEITADTTTFPAEYNVAGTPGSELLHEYFTKTVVNQQKLDSLSLIFVASKHLDNFYEIKQKLDSSFRELFAGQQDFLRHLITENTGSIASLLLLSQRFANKALLSETEDFNLFVKLDSVLYALFPTNSHVLHHHQRVLKIADEKAEMAKVADRLSTGNPAPVLNLPDVTGKTVSMSFIQGKVVLISFWVSYSPPCRAINQQLKEVYQKYRSKGFEIFAVSLDSDKEIWKKSIEIDKLTWTNVSDLAGKNSPVLKLYNLPENLPYFYLIESDGKIAAKGLTMPELRKILQDKFDK